MKILIKIYLLFTGVLYMSIVVFAQEKYTLSGYVRDAGDGEELIGATINAIDLKTGTTTNQYGFYSLTLPAGKHLIIYRYLGFKPTELEINIDRNVTINIEMKPSSRTLGEVVVSGQASDYQIRSAEMGVNRLTPRNIQSIPVLFGEQDILKTMQLLPGITAVGEGNSGLYVRGGNACQNLILLDEAPVYNASHLLGFFSAFNSDAIKDVKIMKGFIPPNYGGRLSSVLDVKMKEGNNKKLTGTGGIGLISSHLQLEGPFHKGKGSFMVTGRRTYADLFLKILPDTNVNSNVLFFYDFNAKANYRISENDRIYISGYLGRDVFRVQKYFGIDWGNQTLSLRWNHLFSGCLFLNTSLFYSNYNYNFNITSEENRFDLYSAIRDVNWKEDFQFYPSSSHTLRFGFKVNYHWFMPGEVSSSGDFPANDMKMETKYALENALYLSHEWKVSSGLTLHYGTRFSSFSIMSPAHIYHFNDEGDVTDTTWYPKHNIIKTYWNIDPRILLNIKTGIHSSVKVSFTRMHQYLHLLSNSSSGTPLDLWIPSSMIVKPQIANQISAGYFHNFKENSWEISVEAYNKNLTHQIDYKNGADIFLNELVESQLVFGSGQAYGIELLIRKNKGLFHGWASYTLARSLRSFKDINQGKTYPAKQDRIHDISLVGIYDLNNKWSFSATWVYYTGNAVTFPSGKYFIENQYVNYYTERNGYRMPPYHRLDLGATCRLNPEKKFRSSLNFSIYNVYARKNAYSISFQTNENDPWITEAVKIYLFSIVPTVTYNFKF